MSIFFYVIQDKSSCIFFVRMVICPSPNLILFFSEWNKIEKNVAHLICIQLSISAVIHSIRVRNKKTIPKDMRID